MKSTGGHGGRATVGKRARSQSTLSKSMQIWLQMVRQIKNTDQTNTAYQKQYIQISAYT
ncbi:hypothetical protein YC2023_037854 [Brassica napus]